MTPELQSTIEDAYSVFAAYRPGAKLTVCHCNCCMDVETERQLRITPLRDIPSKLLAEYTNSAHIWDDDIVAREMRYFLPRYLELLAQDDPPDHMGIDICLRRMGRGDWRGKWPAQEESLIDCYFDALVRANLAKLELQEWPVGWRLAFDFVDTLTLIVTAGGDIERTLAVWDATPDPAAAIHMAALRNDVIATAACTCLHSPFLEDHKDAANAIGAFLMRPKVDARIADVFLADHDPRLDDILSSALPH